jgi:hypothetical protein
VLGIQNLGNVCGAPINIGLLDKNHPTRGAVPAFFGPPHTFVLLQIEAEFLLARDPDIYTIIYYKKIIIYLDLS